MVNWIRKFSVAALAVTLTLPAAFPVSAGSASSVTSTGQTLGISIDSPADGSTTNLPPGSATVTGTATIGPLSESGTVVYVVDVSGSTQLSAGDCNGDGAVNAGDNFDSAGASGTILDCEIAGVIALNGSLAGSPGASAGMVLFASSAAIADVDPAAGQQDFLSPLNADANGNGTADMEDVARSLRYNLVQQFTAKNVGNATNFDAALTKVNEAFTGVTGNKVAFFLSDGVSSTFSTAPGSPLSQVTAADITVNTYSIGTSSTGCGGSTQLQVVASTTGGTCTDVADPSTLASVLVTPVAIDEVKVSLNGGPAMPVALVGSDWTINLSGLLSGPNLVEATVYANDGTTATTSIIIYGNQAPTADAGGPYVVDEGSAIMLNGTGLDPDGDTLSALWAPATYLDDATSFTPTFTGVDDMVESLSLTVTDPFGLSDTSGTTVEVRNVAPDLSAISASLAPQAVGTAVAASATFTDPGTLDTHTADWDWGDGSTTAGTVTQGAGSGSVDDTHVYTTPGIYTLTLTVTDDDGGMDTATFQYIVVYDPDGGFVTGGGWIYSPAGAYRDDPAAEGRANFGFVSKYQRGATVPTGQTQFQFKSGDLNFHSTEYEWLVVAGARAQYKGSGSVNGAGDYGFMLTAIDGQEAGGGGQDKFRVKIWDKSTGDVMYDNQMGGADDAPVNTVLSGGQIVIHR